jgi:hypothetical protein
MPSREHERLVKWIWTKTLRSMDAPRHAKNLHGNFVRIASIKINLIQIRTYVILFLCSGNEHFLWEGVPPASPHETGGCESAPIGYCSACVRRCR